MDKHYSLNKTNSGQSLIEALIAITVLVVGIISLISLLMNARSTAREVEKETIATQLGAEVMEAARFVRDSNWLRREDGDGTAEYYDGLRDGTLYNGYYTWDPTSADPGTAIMFRFTSGGPTTDQEKIWIDGSDYYRQHQIPGSILGWTESGFERIVSTYPICYATGVGEYLITADGDTCASDTEIGIQVRVQITWTIAGDEHVRIFEERLYDWKYAEIL